MFKGFLADEDGATILEYVVGAVLALGVLGTCIWALMGAVRDEGDTTTTAVGNLPDGISAP